MLPVKLSVSDIKHECMIEEGVDNPLISGEIIRLGEGGALTGTLYHKIMQMLPFSLKGTEEVESFLDSLVRSDESGIISVEERSKLEPEKFASFLESELCRRMEKADRNGRLLREQPFMMGFEAGQLYPDRYPGNTELIPVQGIIDCMFEEDGELVIVDYKTDGVPAGDGEELVRKYHSQLELYEKAAASILGLPVREKLLYSFTLDRTIPVARRISHYDGITG